MANFLTDIMDHPDFPRRAKRTVGSVVGAVVVSIIIAMLVFDHEPEQFSVLDQAAKRANDSQQARVTGYVTTATVIELIDTLLDKRGGIYRTIFRLLACLWTMCRIGSGECSSRSVMR